MVQAAPRFGHHQLCHHCNLQLIQSHVAPSHGPPATVLSPLSFPARSLLLPKPHGKREHPKASWSPPIQHGCPTWVYISAPIFHCSLISDSSHNQLHLPAFPILSALLGCHSKSGQVWPHGIEPIFSKLSGRPCNQGELPPSYILGGSHSHPPGSKHSHSCLTYP